MIQYMSVTCFIFFLMIRRPPRSTLFPYTRSSDLEVQYERLRLRVARPGRVHRDDPAQVAALRRVREGRDRKSTRLNSSHPSISYAVFCLKKKTQNNALTALSILSATFPSNFSIYH